MRGNSTNPPASSPCMANDIAAVHGFRLLKVPLDSNRLSSNIPALLVFTTDTDHSKLAPASAWCAPSHWCARRTVGGSPHLCGRRSAGAPSFRPPLAKGWEEKSDEVVNRSEEHTYELQSLRHL